MAHHHHHSSSGTPPLPSVRESTSEPYERDTTIMGASFAGSSSGLRLEPIKHAAHNNSHPSSSFEFGGGMTRQRRSSQDEIRALLQRTTTALDKIVRIRESMEEFVDFKQFEKPPRRQSRALSQDQQQQGTTNHPAPISRLSSGPIIMQEHTRTTPASSYGSTVASSSSEDPMGRSTNSMHSSSSSLNEEDSADNTEDTRSGSSDSNADEGHLQQVTQPQAQAQQAPQVEEEEDDDDDERESGNDTFDDDGDSLGSDSSMSTTELSPLKEARLERLKNIEIAFHEGLPKEFFVAVTRFLFSTIEVKTRHSRFNFYKDSFTGSDAIKEMIVNGFAEDQSTAQRFGNVLVRLGFIEHVSRMDDQLHNSKDNFYRFTKALEYDEGDYLTLGGGGGGSPQERMSITATNYRESVLSRESSGHVEYDFATATDEAHALATEEVLQIFSRVLLKVFERKNKLLFYKGFVGCFLGAEAVNVIRELRLAASLIDAVLLGQCLLDEGIIEPIATTVTTFQDKYIFYRLTKVHS